MNQPTEQQKKEILSKILSSPEFHDSKRYMELLQYLVNKSEKVDTLKETEIAYEVFGKDSKFDPSTDPLIRSYISNLRKKLEHYYLTTSDNCLFRLEIPKGQYLVRYTPINSEIKPTSKKNYLFYIYPALIVLLLLILITREIANNNSSIQNSYAQNPIWKEFFENKNVPTLIAIGDYVLLTEKGKQDGRSFLRIPNVNNEKELLDSINQFPNRFSNLEISDVPYIGAGASIGMFHILKVFQNSNVNISTKLSREITWDDIEKYNIIFVGSFKTLYKLDTLLSRTNIRYNLNPNSLSIYDKSKGETKFLKINWYGGNYEKNYSLILKQSISKSNSILFLSGFSEVGVMDAVKSSTEFDFVKKIEKFSGSKVENELPQFEIISETEGLRYNVLKTKIIHYSKLVN